MSQPNFSNVQFVHGHRTIISIFPLERRLWRDFGPTIQGGRTEYVMPAARKGEFSKLTVFDAFQRVLDPMKSEPGKPGFGPFPESAINIANDLLHHWVDSVIGTQGGFKPGIMLIEGDDPTPAELAALQANQQRYFERLVHEAQHFAESNQEKMITDVHREAARYTGYRPADGESNWVADMGTNTKKECIACFSPIDSRATICRICRAPQGSDAPAAPTETKKGKPGIPPPLAVPVQAAA